MHEQQGDDVLAAWTMPDAQRKHCKESSTNAAAAELLHILGLGAAWDAE